MILRANELDEIRWRLKVSNLEAKVELREIEAATLNCEIRSPFTLPIRRAVAIQRRITVLKEASELKAELDQMSRSKHSWTRH